MAPSGPVPQARSRKPLLTPPSRRMGMMRWRSETVMTLKVALATPPMKTAPR